MISLQELDRIQKLNNILCKYRVKIRLDGRLLAVISSYDMYPDPGGGGTVTHVANCDAVIERYGHLDERLKEL